MNKVFLLIVCFIFSVFTYGQVTKNVIPFSKVVAHDAVTVFLVPSNESKVEISGFQADKVQLKVENMVLYIHFPESNPIEGNDILAKVYFTQLNAVEAHDGCSIGAMQTLQTGHFTILAKESAKIKLNLNTDTLKARISQGSRLDLSGNARDMDLVASNTSKIFATNCITQEATVQANVGAQIYIHVNQMLDATVRAGGSIFIFGNPKKISQQTILGGEITLK